MEYNDKLTSAISTNLVRDKSLHIRKNVIIMSVSSSLINGLANGAHKKRITL